MWSLRQTCFVFALLAGLGLTPGARAADLFGLSSRDAAMAGATSTTVTGGSAAWYNPAGLAFTDRGQLALFYVTMFPRLEASVTNYGSLGHIPGYQVRDAEDQVSVDASRDAIADAVRDAKELDRFAAIGINFNLRINSLFPKLPFRLNLGGNLVIPVESSTSSSFPWINFSWNLATFEAHNADQPYFATMNPPFNQARINLGLGAEVWKNYLWLGLGAAIHSKVKGAVETLTPVASYDASDPAGNPPTASQASTTQSLGMDAALTAAVLGRPLLLGPHEGLISIVYHAEEETAVDLDIDAIMELDLGEPIRMEVPYIMAGSFAYRPHRLVTGLAYRFKERLTVAVDLEIAFWKEFEDHFQVLEMQVSPEALEGGDTIYLDDLGGQFRVATDTEPWVFLRTTYNPKVGLEYLFDFGLATRLGYGYRQSPLLPDQKHLNMMLDNNWHVISAGLGYQFTGRDGQGSQLSIDAHFQCMVLEPRYNNVGRRGEGNQPMASGIIHTEGYVAGFGLELNGRF